jgi:hypothetical protein
MNDDLSKLWQDMDWCWFFLTYFCPINFTTAHSNILQVLSFIIWTFWFVGFSCRRQYVLGSKIATNCRYSKQSVNAFSLRNEKDRYIVYLHLFVCSLFCCWSDFSGRWDSNTVTWLTDYRRGLNIVIGLIELLQDLTTSNCSANVNSRSLQFTTARTKSSQSAVSSPVVPW